MTVRTMVVGDGATSTDVLVIGGGPGGYVAAIRAAQRDLDVTLVEKDAYGGTCLNHGCIPSKAFITAADVAHDAGNADAMGIHADPTVDMAGLAAWKDGVVDQLTSGVEKLCKANGVSLVAGTATFEGEHTARIAHDGDEAVESGYQMMLGFLRAHGALVDEPPTFAPATIIEGLEEVPKGSGEPHVNYVNFEEIPEGEVFASDDEYTHRVQESGIVPVLASEHGYKEIFGLYGRITGTLEPSTSADEIKEQQD